MAKQLFGIFAPVLGLKKDFPVIALDTAYQPDNSNTQITYGEVHRRRMREPDLLDEHDVKSQTPDGYPIIHYHLFVKRTTNTQYLLGFTKKHIYVWEPDSKEWDEIFESDYSYCEEWDSVSYNDKVIATNNVDLVQVWDTTGNFEPLGDDTNGIKYGETLYLTKAKYVTTYENFLILGYTTENSDTHPQRIRWNAIGDEESWDSGDAGSAETEGSDFITGFHIYAGQLIIFKERSRIIQRLVPTDDVWNWAKMPGSIGCISNHSIVEDPEGRLFFLGSDMNIREMQAGTVSQSIDPIIKGIEPSSDYLVYGIHIDETGEIWWAIPYQNKFNNKIVTYKQGAWGILDISAPALGEYKEEEEEEEIIV